MERLPYWTKRAHWKVTYTAIHHFEDEAVRIGQPVLLLMTPARLDILHVIDQRLAWTKQRPGHRPVMLLGDIVQRLGLHPSTISKCVARMEQLGLVTRSRSDDDLRRTVVTVTTLGLQGLAVVFSVLGSLQEELRQFSSRMGDRLMGLADRMLRYAREFGSPAVDLWAAEYVDTG